MVSDRLLCAAECKHDHHNLAFSLVAKQVLLLQRPHYHTPVLHASREVDLTCPISV